MKLLLSCDQVFDVLTRGPFPTGEPSDEAVEHHLRACHECRQLAEALRPAVALMHEAVSAEFAIDLPEYQGSLPPTEDWEAPPRDLPLRSELPTPVRQLDVRQLDRGMRRISRKGRPRAYRVDWGHVIHGARVVAASVLIVALGTLLFGLALATRLDEKGVASTGPSAANRSGDRPEYMPDREGLVTLASLKLPSQCFPPSYALLIGMEQDEPSLAAGLVAEHSVRCCTYCHAAGQPNPPHVRQMAVLQESCSNCHRS